MTHKSARSFIQLFATNVVTKVCWALILLLLLRKLGASSFGILATLWSGAAIAAGFVDFGTSQALLREGSRDHARARPLAAQSARVQAVLTATVAVLLAAGGWFILATPGLSTSQRAWVIVLGVATPLIDRFQALFTVCSQIGGNYNAYTRTRTLYFIALLLAIAWVLHSNGGLLAVSIIYFGLTVLFSILMGFGTWVLLPAAGATRDAAPLKSLLRQGLPFLMVMTLTLAYGRIEVTILGSFGRTAAAGSYHVIYQIVLLVYSVVGMFFTVAYPRLYRHRGDGEALANDFRDTVRWLSLLAWLVAPPLWMFAEPVLHLMGGAPLAAYVPVLRVLAALILFVPASAALNFLLPADMLRARIACDTVGIAITVGISSWAAARNLPIWVAAGEVFGYAAAITLAHLALHRKLHSLPRAVLGEFSGIGLRMVPGAALAWWMPENWWIRALVFVAVGATIVLLTHRLIMQRMRLWFAPPNQ